MDVTRLFPYSDGGKVIYNPAFVSEKRFIPNQENCCCGETTVQHWQHDQHFVYQRVWTLILLLQLTEKG